MCRGVDDDMCELVSPNPGLELLNFKPKHDVSLIYTESVINNGLLRTVKLNSNKHPINVSYNQCSFPRLSFLIVTHSADRLVFRTQDFLCC